MTDEKGENKVVMPVVVAEEKKRKCAVCCLEDDQKLQSQRLDLAVRQGTYVELCTVCYCRELVDRDGDMTDEVCDHILTQDKFAALRADPEQRTRWKGIHKLLRIEKSSIRYLQLRSLGVLLSAKGSVLAPKQE